MAARSDAWDTAKHLVVSGGATYAEAAEATGLSLSTIQKRAAAEDWQGAKETATNYNAMVQAMKTEALRKARDTKDPNDIHAWLAIEKAYPQHRYGRPDPKLRLDAGAAVIELLVTFLAEHDRSALLALQPHLVAVGEQWERQCLEA